MRESAASESDFERLLDEWRSISAAGSPNLADWASALESIAREEQGLRARGAWVHGRDDLFGILGIQRAEVRHSSMIAWLLDPCARHGLGTRFLVGLLRRAFPRDHFSDLAGARTTCEVARGECRADIIVTTSNATIVIENKVDAEESPRQCDVLYERFIEDVGARFIFLTPTGRAPHTASGEAADAFAAVGYADIRSALEEALTETSVEDAPWGRHAALDYQRTLQREFR